MPFAIVGDVVKVRVICSNVAQSAVNVRYYSVTAQAGTGCTDSEIATTLGGILAPLYKGLLVSAAQFRLIGVQLIRGANAFVEVLDPALVGPGTVLGDPLPPQVAGLIKLTTDQAGRHGRGFIYVPFGAEADSVAAGAPQQSYIDRLNALGAAWIASRSIGPAGNTSTLTAYLWRKSLGTTFQITGARAKNVWSQQKRRSFVRRGDLVPAGSYSGGAMGTGMPGG